MSQHCYPQGGETFRTTTDSPFTAHLTFQHTTPLNCLVVEFRRYLVIPPQRMRRILPCAKQEITPWSLSTEHHELKTKNTWNEANGRWHSRYWNIGHTSRWVSISRSKNLPRSGTYLVRYKNTRCSEGRSFHWHTASLFCWGDKITR